MQGQCGSTNYYCREQEKVVGLAGLISGDWYAHALLHAIIGGCGFDLPKSGAAMAAPAAPLPTPLVCIRDWKHDYCADNVSYVITEKTLWDCSELLVWLEKLNETPESKGQVGK